ncbi:kinase-like protein [Thelephora ganbajun]|uniref:Kinase-like protein n=1 Tax=Thelephora ganbajun TaxID=370292 RepID=A0ACB6Z4P7_THEGA|nr:kinase-like protein [Thelephora ganbajun]
MERRGASQSSSELLASDPSTHRNRGIHFSASARPLWPQVFTSKNRVIARCLCGLRVVFRILDKSSLRYSDLVSIFCEKQFRERVSSLQHEDVAQLVDYLDSIIHTLEPASSASQMYLRRLAWACSTQKILPKSCTISDTLLNTGGRPCASGILADMYEGSLDGFKVCVEKVRMYSDGGDPENVTRMFFKEAVMRKHFMHRNVVPFLGAILNPPQIVSVWMPGGCLAEYVTTHPEKSRLDLLYDVAQGLDYLHSHDVVHGDLKGQNILVDATGHARITGLGLITATLDLESTTPFAEGPVARFTAPEILGGDTTASKEADVFSFAMIMIEVFTGAAPFVHSPPVTVAVRILAGKRPERPAHSSLTDELWDLNRRCWDQQPLSRPRISEVVGYLRTVLAIQEGHADESGISVKYDTISSSSRQKEQLHRLPREPTYSTATRWLLALWKPRKSSDEYQDALDQLPGIESDTPGDSLHNMKSGEREKLLGKRNVPSGSRGLLRRATFWLSDHGACATQNWHGRPDASAEKHGAAQKLNNTPPTSNRTEPRSCMSLKPFIFQLSRFSPCRSNKYMEQ